MGRRLGAQFYAPSTWVTKQNNRTIVLLFLGEKRRFSLTSFRWVFSSIFIARKGCSLTFAIVLVFSHISEMAEFPILPTWFLSFALPRNEVQQFSEPFPGRWSGHKDVVTHPSSCCRPVAGVRYLVGVF